MINHITKSDMRSMGIDLNRSLHRIVQATLNREYAKEVTKYTQDELETEGAWTKIGNNYTAHAYNKLTKCYGVKTTNVEQPDGSIKQVCKLQLKKYYRDDKHGGEITEFFGNYTMLFNMATYEQTQAGEQGITFVKGWY